MRSVVTFEPGDMALMDSYALGGSKEGDHPMKINMLWLPLFDLLSRCHLLVNYV